MKHLTNSVILVRPIDFAYNEQTGKDNEFQNRPEEINQSDVQRLVLDEFENTISQLNSFGIETLILGKQHTDNHLPDAVFPNNWFSTRSTGDLIIYPMKTQNRRNEVQIDQLSDLLNSHEYKINRTFDLRTEPSKTNVLEGTGSLIFHHPSNHVFAAVSDRCLENPLSNYAKKFNVEVTKFDTSSSHGNPIYHTNVLMSCGQDFGVIVKEVILESDQDRVVSTLADRVSDIIILNEKQMSENFCGNILQLQDKNNQPVIALSHSAYKGFEKKQLLILEKHGSLVICPIPTIERVGGGSVRCMLAENFIPTSH